MGRRWRWLKEHAKLSFRGFLWGGLMGLAIAALAFWFCPHWAVLFVVPVFALLGLAGGEEYINLAKRVAGFLKDFGWW